MSLFEIMMANQIWSRRNESRRVDPLNGDSTSAAAMLARFAAVFLVFAIIVAALDRAGDRYESLSASAVAASRQ